MTNFRGASSIAGRTYLACMEGTYRQRPPVVRPGELECPGCAGGVPASARSCPHCGNDARPLRCAHCYHANVADASLCEGCGDPLGAQPMASPADLDCKQCGVSFEAFAAATGTLYDCPRCGGQFAHHAVVRELIAQREALLGSEQVVRFNPLTSPVRYRPCPRCGIMMNRRNFGGVSGVIIDECATHGVWFDHAELPRILRFVASGGLTLAKTRYAPPAASPVSKRMTEQPLGLAQAVFELLGFLTSRDR